MLSFTFFTLQVHLHQTAMCIEIVDKIEFMYGELCIHVPRDVSESGSSSTAFVT